MVKRLIAAVALAVPLFLGPAVASQAAPAGHSVVVAPSPVRSGLCSALKRHHASPRAIFRACTPFTGGHVVRSVVRSF